MSTSSFPPCTPITGELEFRADILDQLRDLKSEVEIVIASDTSDEHAASLLDYLEACYRSCEEATVCNEAGDALFIGHVLGVNREIYPSFRHTFKLLGKAV